MCKLTLLVILLCLAILGAGTCSADTIPSCLGHQGPAFAPGMTPSKLGWGPDDKPYPDKFVVNPKDGAEMVWVPAGEFTMGSPEGEGGPDEHPQHKVVLSAYWMYKTEVTYEQYDGFSEWMKKTGDHSKCFKGEPANIDHTRPYWTVPNWDGPKQPVGVDWYDAYAYAAWAGQRLPTEAEWEKAARGTDGRRYPWGNEWEAGKCSSDKSRKGVAADVGSYPAGHSPYGCLDMAGSLWEWCADRFDANYYRSSPRENPTGPATGDLPVLRGGGPWNGGDTGYLRAASRTAGFGPLVRVFLFGFRCARTP